MDDKKWIVVDLDGTICDCSHRVHLAQAKQWDEFHAGIPDDVPKREVCEIISVLSEHYDIVLCTGRDEKYRIATELWLNKEDIWFVDTILMRPKDNRESDDVVKIRLVDEWFGSREKALKKVHIVLDDSDRTVAAFRDAGFKCWQVAAGDF